MEVWLKVKLGDSFRVFQVENIKIKEDEIIYSTVDYGTIYQTMKDITILDISQMYSECQIFITA
jgi:hypothetical protein